MTLPSPPAGFADLPLHIRNVPVTALRRIGRHDGGEPYFGKYAANRFDDPRKRFGTCYCGQHLDSAIAETVLHDEVPEKGQLKIRKEDIDARYLAYELNARVMSITVPQGLLWDQVRNLRS